MAENDVQEIADYGITLSDGCRLSARVWRPKGETPVPVILEYLPYRKRDGTTARDCLTHPYFARHGYACVRVDMRGNGDSQGVMLDEYAPQELNDAVEVINHLAAQDWCSGTVGMMGISWGGFNALQVAAMEPEPLKAIITLCSTADRYADDIHYKGGCLLNENLGWGATMWAYSSRAPDPDLVGDAWREMWLERLEAEPFLPALWLNHQHRDAYWKHGSICEDFAAVKAATLAIGGWGDAYKNTVPNLVENLSAPVKGIVGPWVHKYPHFAVPEPRIGFLQEALRWWDHYLKGIETGVDKDPAYTAYVMDGVRPRTWYEERAGRWVCEPNAVRKNGDTYHLNAQGRLGGQSETVNALVASPQNCGMSGGEYCAIWLGPELPGDQRADDGMSVCFTSEPLEADFDVFGAPRIKLCLTSDKPNGQIAVRLNHIHPDGASTRITYGVLNLTHRQSHEHPEPCPTDAPFEISLDLDHIAYQVPKGHRIRVSISNAYWPMIWPSPEAAELILVEGTVDIPRRASGQGDERSFPEPDAAEPWQIETLRKAHNTREIVTDMATGGVSLQIVDDFGHTRDLDHGLEVASVARETWSIHPDDPLSARGVTHWTEENRRGDWAVRTETYGEMWSDATTFYLKARLEAYEGDTLVFEKDESFEIPRDLL